MQICIIGSVSNSGLEAVRADGREMMDRGSSKERISELERAALVAVLHRRHSRRLEMHSLALWTSRMVGKIVCSSVLEREDVE